MWEIIIGLETHVQLATKSKIFSVASTSYGAKANTPTAPKKSGSKLFLILINN